ncbi:MAG: metallophosphoesterase [Anaerolineales bacterium]|nr:metallophosphoesterase [Anaerolineales bacterium]
MKLHTIAACLLLVLLSTGWIESRSADSFTFAVSADMRYFSGPGEYDTSQYFRGAVEAIASLGGSAFMVSPGDIDPTVGVYWTITQTLGTAFTWYPVIGNHELPGEGTETNPGDNLAWLNAYDYGPVNPGPPACPKTTYSFDYQEVHFVALNQYCDSAGEAVTDGDIPDYLYNWLVADLDSTTQPTIFVIGHEPAFPTADIDTGRLRHQDESLDKYLTNRDRFWSLLQAEGVIAYLCGHTHNYSAIRVGDVWQIDAGHARGLGDTGAPSTFVLIHVRGDTIQFEAYRDDANGGSYSRRHAGYLQAPYAIHLPVVLRASP